MRSWLSTELLKTSQQNNVKIDRTNTAGANIAAILSAIAWIGALFTWASSINRTILAMTVSAPVAVTLIISVED